MITRTEKLPLGNGNKRLILLSISRNFIIEIADNFLSVLQSSNRNKSAVFG